MEICLDGSNIGGGLAVALSRPPFKRFNNSIRLGGSQRSRRPTSLLVTTDVINNNKGGEQGTNVSSTSETPSAWATSFEKLLDDPMGLHTFAEFLKKEFSAENIYFWAACERYRRLLPGPERRCEAQRIYQQHLCSGAPEPVNVDSHGRQCTEIALNEANDTLFDQAQKQIFNLMKFDSYPRFLKSNLYKQCLNGNIEKPQLDVGLLLQPTIIPTKLKKSLSNAEDRRRKSLLPWHRKNRSKSKDRGESEYNNNQKKNDETIINNDNINGGKIEKSDICSSRSSLTSLDLAISAQESIKNGNSDEARTSLCRVILSNGSTTVVQIKDNTETIQDLIKRLLEKRGLNYSSFEVYTDKHSKALDINNSSKKLAGCEVTVEQRVVFKLDLPNRKVISVKSKFTKIIIDVLKPILHKYNYNLNQVKVTLKNEDVDLHLPVTSIDGARLNIQFCEDVKNQINSGKSTIKINNIQIQRLEEITNKVFEGILQEKADSASIIKPNSGRESIKSDDWGSEHSSGIFGRFLRRDSGIHDRKKKSLISKSKGSSMNGSSSEDVANEQNQMKKPLIAKWKAGVNKLQVTCSESDELVEGLTRAQRSRLEDQRGTEINFELPDFLKDKENENFRKPLRRVGQSDARFCMGENNCLQNIASAKNLKLDLQSNSNNYENRTIMNNLGQTNQMKISNNLRHCSPNKLSSDESPLKSNQITPIKLNWGNISTGNLNNTKNSEPPPLPPKPKIIPIKPPNWGQNDVNNKEKHSLTEKNKALFLDQSSSSFV